MKNFRTLLSESIINENKTMKDIHKESSQVLKAKKSIFPTDSILISKVIIPAVNDANSAEELKVILDAKVIELFNMPMGTGQGSGAALNIYASYPDAVYKAYGPTEGALFFNVEQQSKYKSKFSSELTKAGFTIDAEIKTAIEFSGQGDTGTVEKMIKTLKNGSYI